MWIVPDTTSAPPGAAPCDEPAAAVAAAMRSLGGAHVRAAAAAASRPRTGHAGLLDERAAANRGVTGVIPALRRPRSPPLPLHAAEAGGSRRAARRSP